MLTPSKPLRDYNRERVLAVLRESVSASRAEIVTRTGLSRTTIAGLVDDLMSEGTVRTVAEHATRRTGVAGRRPTMLALSRGPGFALALDLAHASIRVARVGLDGELQAHRMTRIDPALSAKSMIALARELLREIVDEAGLALSDSRSVVAAIPEPIDQSGVVSRTNRRSRWTGRNPAAMLSAVLHVPVYAENDANLAAIGERLYGTVRGVDDLIYVKVGRGIGTGIIMRGSLIRGADGIAGEVGHIQVRPDGLICTCGNRGCLYTLVSGEYLARLLQGATDDPNLRMRKLAALARSGNPGGRRLVHDAGVEVGKVLANICTTLNPAAIVLGGSLAHAGTDLLGGFTEAMERYTAPPVRARMTISFTSLKETAELLGAAAVAVGIADLPGVAITRATGLRASAGPGPATAAR